MDVTATAGSGITADFERTVQITILGFLKKNIIGIAIAVII